LGGSCDPANEPINSTLSNFIEAFFGTITKTCVNGEVVWTLPADLTAGIPGIPRLPNEGLASYIFRIMLMLGVFPQSVWNSSTTYPANAFVSYCGSAYVSLGVTTNNNPATSPASWQLFVSGAYTCGI